MILLNHKKEIINIIPRPNGVRIKKGKFRFNNDLIIFHKPKLSFNAKYLRKWLTDFFNHFDSIKIQETNLIGDYTNPNRRACIFLDFLNDESEINNNGEEYQLDISEDRILITGLNMRGIFYGIQSLLQLLLIPSSTAIPCLIIDDSPRFEWRGFMLDVARNFFSIEVVKKLLDVMALLKMNKLHLHLTDDQGWRIEIKKYPELTRIGSTRQKSNIGGIMIRKQDSNPHSGYYSQDDIKELLAYAEKRYIDIIPEIDMPGHSLAALTSYPKCGCTGGPYEIAAQFGIFKDVFCLGNDKSIQFLKDVLKEICILFNSKIIHIGGDEVPVNRWKKCPACQSKMKKLKLEHESELQDIFTREITDFLFQRDKKPMAWNEVLKSKYEINKEMIIQYWIRDEDLLMKFLEKGGKVVMSPFGRVYLNYDYIVTPLRSTYNYEPVSEEISKNLGGNIIGVEAAHWTQWTKNPYNLFLYTFPRLIAIAETGWTLREKKNYKSFKLRLKDSFLPILNQIGINYMPLERTDPCILKRLTYPFHILFGSKQYVRNK
ncbi:MAG: family 20 glycosylhydrolase [Candidatus Lokiarchaeota archaeon]|nr:family 20 glycosylhydrolase [Candidatus Lokiarchaeota archaeon]